MADASLEPEELDAEFEEQLQATLALDPIERVRGFATLTEQLETETKHP